MQGIWNGKSNICDKLGEEGKLNRTSVENPGTRYDNRNNRMALCPKASMTQNASETTESERADLTSPPQPQTKNRKEGRRTTHRQRRKKGHIQVDIDSVVP